VENEPGHFSVASLSRPAGLKKYAGALTLVCGPPGSGKTTYCQLHAGPEDNVIDLDAIRSELSGAPFFKASSHWLIPALKERNKRLIKLAENKAGQVFFIVSAPTSRERQWWVEKLGVWEVVVLAVPKTECVRRCENDGARSAGKDYRYLIGLWWKKYTPRRGDIVLR
jgi:5-methylcytosine-specific restriction protein A